MLKRYDIIERLGPNNLYCWTVDTFEYTEIMAATDYCDVLL